MYDKKGHIEKLRQYDNITAILLLTTNACPSNYDNRYRKFYESKILFLHNVTDFESEVMSTHVIGETCLLSAVLLKNAERDRFCKDFSVFGSLWYRCSY